MSKRFAALCGTPELLQDAHISFRSLSQADCASAWLLQHSRHMHRLELVAWAGDDMLEGSYASAFATCLSAAGTAAQLTRLSVGALRFDLHTEWLRTMRSLRKLTLTTDNALHIAPAVSALTALQSLGLRSSGLQLPAEVRLPTSITRLWVNSYSENMPQQASRVCCLDAPKACNWACERRNALLQTVHLLADPNFVQALIVVLPHSLLACSLPSCRSCSG